MQSKIQSPETDALFQAVLSLKTMEDCYRFFEDICTIKEIRDISQRLEVARMLKAGDTVASIAQRTGASTTTVSSPSWSTSRPCAGRRRPSSS